MNKKKVLKSPFSCKFQALFLEIKYYNPVNICKGKIHSQENSPL